MADNGTVPCWWCAVVAHTDFGSSLSLSMHQAVHARVSLRHQLNANVPHRLQTVRPQNLTGKGMIIISLHPPLDSQGFESE